MKGEQPPDVEIFAVTQSNLSMTMSVLDPSTYRHTLRPLGSLKVNAKCRDPTISFGRIRTILYHTPSRQSTPMPPIRAKTVRTAPRNTQSKEARAYPHLYYTQWGTAPSRVSVSPPPPHLAAAPRPRRRSYAGRAAGTSAQRRVMPHGAREPSRQRRRLASAAPNAFRPHQAAPSAHSRRRPIVLPWRTRLG
jgi:hypothetical protein